MTSVERVKSICKTRRIPISKLEQDCGFSNGYISSLKKGVLPDDRLKIIAEYLDVPVLFLMIGSEYISEMELSKTDTALSNMSERMKIYALKMAELPSEKQEQIMSLIDMFGE